MEIYEYESMAPYSNSRVPLEFTPGEELSGLDTIVGSTLNIIQFVGYALSALLFILAIVFLVKSIMDRKKLNEGNFETAIGSIKTTSIILLIVNILAICSNFIMTIIAIISTVFASKAKRLLLNDVELAKSKAKTASLLNIIISALMILSPILTVLYVTLLNIVWSVGM